MVMVVPRFTEEAGHFGNQPTLFLSLVTPHGHLEHYDGVLRIDLRSLGTR